MDTLQKKIEILERALQFYGNPKQYENGAYWNVVIDAGTYARKALKEASKYGQEKEKK